MRKFTPKSIGIIGDYAGVQIYINHIEKMSRQKMNAAGKDFALPTIHFVAMDFSEVYELRDSGDHISTGLILHKKADKLAADGANCILLAHNGLHNLRSRIGIAIPLYVKDRYNHDIKFIDIVHEMAYAIKDSGARKIGLLGQPTDDFYAKEIADKTGAKIIGPAQKDGAEIRKIITAPNALQMIEAYKGLLNRVCYDMITKQGATGIALGCVKLGNAIEPHMNNEAGQPCFYIGGKFINLFDSAKIHAQAAVDFVYENHNAATKS